MVLTSRLINSNCLKQIPFLAVFYLKMVPNESVIIVFFVVGLVLSVEFDVPVYCAYSF